MAIVSPLSSHSANHTAAALRSALGPGYGFGGPSDRLFNVAVGNAPVVGPIRRRS